MFTTFTTFSLLPIDGDEAQRRACAASDFHRQTNHRCPARRQLANVGRVFDNQDAVGEQLLMYSGQVECIVGTGRVESDRLDAAFDEETRGVQ